MTTRRSVLSTADVRRPVVAAAALRQFARGGFHRTTVADVAQDAKISPAYVFKLFPRKEALFTAALELCFDEIDATLVRGVDEAEEQTPTAILDAMGAAYAELISDRDLLMLQVHAQSASEVPEIGAALRAGIQRITQTAQSRSGAAPEDVQRFLAYGQLCHLIVTIGLTDSTEPWAELITRGIRHP